MQLHRQLFTGISFTLVMSFFLLSPAPKKTNLFLPNKKSEWHTFLRGSGKNNDPKNVFQFEGDVLHVSGRRIWLYHH